MDPKLLLFGLQRGIFVHDDEDRRTLKKPHLDGESNLPGLLLPDHHVEDPMAQRQVPALGVPDLGHRVLLALLQVLDGVAQGEEARLVELRLPVLALDALLQSLDGASSEDQTRVNKSR